MKAVKHSYTIVKTFTTFTRIRKIKKKINLVTRFLRVVIVRFDASLPITKHTQAFKRVPTRRRLRCFKGPRGGAADGLPGRGGGGDGDGGAASASLAASCPQL